MPEATWATVELPVMAAIAQRTPKPGRSGPFSHDIAEATGLDSEKVVVALGRLEKAGYLTGSRMHNAGSVQYANLHMTERGLRETGVWPRGDPFDELVTVLKDQIATEADADRAGRLRRLLSAVTDTGRDLAVEVLSKVITHGMGV